MLFAPQWADPSPVALPAGVWWAAVRVNENDGRAVLERILRTADLSQVGAVVGHQGHWWFFVPATGTPPHWPPNTCYRGYGFFITVPPPHQHNAAPGDPYWARTADEASGRILTAPQVLRPALTALTVHTALPARP